MHVGFDLVRHDALRGGWRGACIAVMNERGTTR